ncbi:hypothetical protein [Marinobacter changyiensis]|uniref:hypothetical protein n=1 Tax=Marinobacter changyiensis TaxID=2604091 RepID=UPI0012643C69|nr:hypothetical protein [Marinobacter changyiensis]
MSWKDIAAAQLARIRAKLDTFNQSLADKALPEDRKSRVGKLSLEQKASAAGQGEPKLKAVKGGGRAKH